MQKISIITVVYNDVEHIAKTINNVLKQTYGNVEYIVVDGGSNDGTLDVIKQYEGKIKWISEPDKGIYDAMMKGAKMATGEWLLYRNCGDFFFSPASIEQMFNLYNVDDRVDFLLANSRCFNDWGYCDIKPPILTNTYMEIMPVLHPSTFIKRTTQLKYPFHLEYKNSADYCFFVEAFKDGAEYKYYDFNLALIDCAEGATAEHYERSIKDNIEIMRSAGASANRIAGLERVLKRQLLANKIRKIIPFYNYFIKRKKLRSGWVICNKEQILANI